MIQLQVNIEYLVSRFYKTIDEKLVYIKKLKFLDIIKLPLDEIKEPGIRSVANSSEQQSLG